MLQTVLRFCRLPSSGVVVYIHRKNGIRCSTMSRALCHPVYVKKKPLTKTQGLLGGSPPIAPPPQPPLGPPHPLRKTLPPPRHHIRAKFIVFLLVPTTFGLLEQASGSESIRGLIRCHWSLGLHSCFLVAPQNNACAFFLGFWQQQGAAATAALLSLTAVLLCCLSFMRTCGRYGQICVHDTPLLNVRVVYMRFMVGGTRMGVLGTVQWTGWNDGICGVAWNGAAV